MKAVVTWIFAAIVICAVLVISGDRTAAGLACMRAAVACG